MQRKRSSTEIYATVTILLQGVHRQARDRKRTKKVFDKTDYAIKKYE